MKKATKNWVKSACYDLETAKAMFKSRRYVYVIFMCHLSVEKLLKAIVGEILCLLPPKTHDLSRLLKLAGLKLPEEHQKIVAHLNEASIPTRYPEDLSILIKQYNRQVAQRYLKETEGVIKWLNTNPRLKK